VTLSSLYIHHSSGWPKALTSEYCGNATAFFMNSVQIGAAVWAPLSRMSL